MRRPRFFHISTQGKLKKVVVVLIIAGLFLMLLPNNGIYEATLSGLRSVFSVLRSEWDVKLDKFKSRIHSPTPGDYRLVNPQMTDFSRGQCKIIEGFLHDKENGFFVDVGAGDGETDSVSLYFEREKKWSGVLVEADTDKHRAAISKNRQSQMWNFRIRLDNETTPDSEGDIRPDQLLEMINHDFIDLLIVNMHDLELDFIRQIDFAKYHIKVITIELHIDVSSKKYMDITDLLLSHGFIMAHHFLNHIVRKRDMIYVKS